LREAARPDAWLAMDANCGYTLADAKRSPRLAPLDFAWFEEPMPPEDVDGYVALRSRRRSRSRRGIRLHTLRFRDVLAKGMMDISTRHDRRRRLHRI